MPSVVYVEFLTVYPQCRVVAGRSKGVVGGPAAEEGGENEGGEHEEGEPRPAGGSSSA